MHENFGSISMPTESNSMPTESNSMNNNSNESSSMNNNLNTNLNNNLNNNSNGNLHENTRCPSTNLGKSEQCQGCPNQSICGTLKVDDTVPLINQNISKFKSVIAVMSGKGGVGKSTITRNISEYLSYKPYKVLILDLDLSGPSIPKMTHTEGEVLLESNNTIYPIKISPSLGCISMGYFLKDQKIFNSSYKTNLIRNILMNGCFEDYDTLIIDTPPNITDEHLAIVNYLKVDFSIIVTTPQLMSFQDVIRQVTFCNKNNIKILGIIENMKGFECQNCKHIQNIFNDTNIEYLCKKSHIEYLGSLPLNIEYGKRGDEGLIIENTVINKVVEKVITNLVNNTR